MAAGGKEWHMGHTHPVFLHSEKITQPSVQYSNHQNMFLLYTLYCTVHSIANEFGITPKKMQRSVLLNNGLCNSNVENFGKYCDSIFVLVT